MTKSTLVGLRTDKDDFIATPCLTSIDFACPTRFVMISVCLMLRFDSAASCEITDF